MPDELQQKVCNASSFNKGYDDELRYARCTSWKWEYGMSIFWNCGGGRVMDSLHRHISQQLVSPIFGGGMPQASLRLSKNAMLLKDDGYSIAWKYWLRFREAMISFRWKIKRSGTPACVARRSIMMQHRGCWTYKYHQWSQSEKRCANRVRE